jgi:hypothetical protein
MAPAARLVAFLLAVLVAFPLSSFGMAHAHPGSAAAAHFAIGQPEVAAAAAYGHQEHAHAVPCDDRDADQGGNDDCCMSATSCAVCVPVPSADFVFGMAGDPATSVALSVSLPGDSPPLSRPPKLSAPA